MDNSLFINDLRQELGSLPTVNSPVFKYKEYESIVVDSSEYIIAKGLIDPHEPKSNLYVELGIECESAAYGSFEILFSLIQLVKIKGYQSKDFDKIPDDEIISNNDIIEWCYKYGLPFFPTTQIKEDLTDSNGEKVEAGFLTGSFRLSLSFLYGCFNLWRAIYEKNSNDIDKYAAFLGILKNAKFKNLDEKISTLKSSFPLLSIGSIELRPRYDAKTDAFGFGIYTRDIFQVAYFQLATLMTKTSKEIKDNFKMCPACSSMFWGHGNRKYCPNCNRKTIWSRKQKEQS